MLFLRSAGSWQASQYVFRSFDPAEVLDTEPTSRCVRVDGLGRCRGRRVMHSVRLSCCLTARKQCQHQRCWSARLCWGVASGVLPPQHACADCQCLLQGDHRGECAVTGQDPGAAERASGTERQVPAAHGVHQQQHRVAGACPGYGGDSMSLCGHSWSLKVVQHNAASTDPDTILRLLQSATQQGVCGRSMEAHKDNGVGSYASGHRHVLRPLIRTCAPWSPPAAHPGVRVGRGGVHGQRAAGAGPRPRRPARRLGGGAVQPARSPRPATLGASAALEIHTYMRAMLLNQHDPPDQLPSAPALLVRNAGGLAAQRRHSFACPCTAGADFWRVAMRWSKHGWHTRRRVPAPM